MIFVSYYTPGDYEKVMNTCLRPCLEAWDLKHYIKEVCDLGDWFKNTSYKSKFILECLEKFKEDIVFLDSDATIEEYPQLLFDIPKDCDIAVHWFDWYLHWRNKKGNAKRDLLSGTMMMRYNPEVIELVKDWIEQCDNAIGTWEQKILQELIEQSTAVNVFGLPASYCAVIDRERKVPEYIDNPVIIHWQASRQYKNK